MGTIRGGRAFCGSAMLPLPIGWPPWLTRPSLSPGPCPGLEPGRILAPKQLRRRVPRPPGRESGGAATVKSLPGVVARESLG